MMNVGETIRELRKSKNLNQDQLAELANLNRVTVAKYESGKIEPGAQALSRLADALEVTVDDILGRKKEPVSEETDDEYIELESACVEPSTPEEYRLLSGFRSLNEAGQQFILQTLDTAVASNIYKQGDLSLGKEAE